MNLAAFYNSPMKKSFMMAFCFFGLNCAAYAPTIDLILAEMAKHCLRNKGPMKGILQSGDDISFVDLTLNDEGLMIVSKESVTGKSAKSTAQEKIDLAVVQELVTCEAHGAKRLKDYLHAHGIDTAKVNHGMVGGDPAFIIGADPADTKAPQLWIDKQSFLPLIEKTADEQISFEHWAFEGMLSDKKWPSTLRIKRGDAEKKLDMAEATALRAKRK
jgi:hypothetical protein